MPVRISLNEMANKISTIPNHCKTVTCSDKIILAATTATGSSTEPSIVAKLEGRCGALMEKQSGGKTAPKSAPPNPYSQKE